MKLINWFKNLLIKKDCSTCKFMINDYEKCGICDHYQDNRICYEGELWEEKL